MSPLDTAACKLLGVTNPCAYQAILGLKDGATDKEINSAFRKKALVFHPDKAVGDDKKAVHNTALNMLNDAKETLLRTAPKARRPESEDVELGSISKKQPSEWSNGTIASFENEKPATKPVVKLILAPTESKSVVNIENSDSIESPAGGEEVELGSIVQWGKKTTEETALVLYKPTIHSDVELTTCSSNGSEAG